MLSITARAAALMLSLRVREELGSAGQALGRPRRNEPIQGGNRTGTLNIGGRWLPGRARSTDMGAGPAAPTTAERASQNVQVRPQSGTSPNAGIGVPALGNGVASGGRLSRQTGSRGNGRHDHSQ